MSAYVVRPDKVEAVMWKAIEYLRAGPFDRKDWAFLTFKAMARRTGGYIGPGGVTHPTAADAMAAWRDRLPEQSYSSPPRLTPTR